jgi:hypothetical protein
MVWLHAPLLIASGGLLKISQAFLLPQPAQVSPLSAHPSSTHVSPILAQ